MSSSTGPALSFVVPVHNEEESLRELHRVITENAQKERYEYEIVYVDDGSGDRSFEILKELATTDTHVRAVRLRRNYGQTAALNAGIHESKEPVIITLDADLQNDPADVPRLLAKLNEGFDVVSGWRKDRQDNWLRRFPSKIANALISRVTGVRLSDYGCTLKAYRREFLEDIPLYGEMHRFIPVLAAWYGAKVTEIPVTHHARKYGKSHYGIRRTGKVTLDLLTVKFLHTYIARPMHFFGGIGIWLMGLGSVAGIAAVILKIIDVRDFVDTPLLLLSVFLLIIGILFLLMGLLAELLIRIYFGQSGRSSYRVRNVVGGDIAPVHPHTSSL